MRRIALAGLFAFGAPIAIAAIGPIVSACSSTPPTPPDLVTINGQVVQGSVPAVGAYVYANDVSGIAGDQVDGSLFPVPGPIAADGTGHFVVGGFGSVYDLAIFPASAPHDATIVQGLTTRTPLVSLPLPENTPLHTCHISTTWVTPPPPGATIAYFLQPPTYPGVELVSVALVDSNLADGLIATWRGSISTTVNVWTMVFVRDAKTNLPSSYVGYASTYAWLIDQRDAPFVISLQTITSSSLTVNLQAPNGYSVESADVLLNLSTGSTSLDLAHFDTPNVPLAVDVPDLPGNSLLLRGVADNGTGVSSAAAIAIDLADGGAIDAGLDFPTTPTLISPNDGATNIDLTTSFSWNGSGVNEIVFTSTDGTAPTLRIVTAAQSFKLGQFLALSQAAIPAGARYTWTVRSWPTFATVDAFENVTADLPNSNNAISGSRGFTFATPL